MSLAAIASVVSQQPSVITHPKYRADIDGLRAVAVLSVVGFHAFPDFIKGGFIGVDIFFVISGFLISTIIIENLARESFSFVDFYSRRIKRIFPALLSVLILTSIFGWFTLTADEYKQLGKHIASGSAFASNFVLWTESGYFDNAAETKLLLHLWSLGIEEQFYIVWPLLLWIGFKMRLNLLVIAIAIGILSFVLNIREVPIDPVSTFYLPHTRIWELLAGAIMAGIALNNRKVDAHSNRRLDFLRGTISLTQTLEVNRKIIDNTKSLVGGALITIGLLLIKKDDQFPGWLALLPVAGAVFLIAAGPQAWLNRTVLGSRVFVWVGLISYPLYLWHWPMLTFARIIENEAPSLEIRSAAVLLSIAFAYLTYRFIERSVRLGDARGAKTATLLALMMAVGFVGLNCYKRDGYGFREIAKLTKNFSEAKRDWKYTPTTLVAGKIETLNVLPGQSSDSVLFIGDSLMGQYFPRATHIYKQTPAPYYTTVFAARNHCHPLPDLEIVTVPENVKCSVYWSAAISLAKRAQFKKIVFGGSWAELNSANTELLIDDLNQLKAIGKEIILITQPPRSPDFDPTNLSGRLRREYLFGAGGDLKDFSIHQSSFENLDLYKALLVIAETTGSKLINPLDYFCPQHMCPAIINSNALYIDAFHIRASYAEKYATFIDEIVINK